MKIQAPFVLHTVPVDTSTGQAAGARWYIAPFVLWRRRVFAGPGTKWLLSFEYARPGQYIGSMSWYGGRESWRQM